MKDKIKQGQQIQNVILKDVVELDTRLSYQIIFTSIFITKRYQNNFFSMVDFLFQHIQDLNNQPNVTNRGFGSLILEEYLNLMDGPYVKTAGEMISFWKYD